MFITIILIKGFGVSAQVVYSDINPDIIYHYSSNTTVTYNFDINNDAVPDLQFVIYNYYGDFTAHVLPVNNSAIVSSTNYVDTLNVHDTIGPSCIWSTAGEQLGESFGGSSGLWCSVNNKFIGVRLISGQDTLYAWVRMDVACDYGMMITVKDMAYDTISNQPIIAGSGIPSVAENVIASDVGNNKNGSDLKVSFDRAIDESKVGEYRVIVVKASDAAGFTLDSARNVAPGNYTSVIPNGQNIADTLPSNANDRNGAPVAEFIAYKVFVLSIADGIISTQNYLSLPSDSIVLTSPATAVTNLKDSMSFQGNNIYRVKVSFNKIQDESTISAYRIIFVKSTSAGSFNKDSASSLPTAAYYSIPPAGTNILINFSSDTLHDYSSGIISHAYSYKIFVLSVADGVHANVDALSAPSSAFLMSSPTVPILGLQAIDFTDSGSPSDMQILFDSIHNESTIAGYRLIGVKLAECDSFNIDTANLVQTGNYIPVNCSGTNINMFLPVSAKDKDGDPIVQNTPYRFYVLTMADNIHTDKNALSLASNIISLAQPDYFKAGKNTGAGVHYVDIVPDSSLGEYFHNSNENFTFDLNNDGIKDFNIHTESSSSPGFGTGYAYITPLTNNAFCAVQEGSINPDTLRLNDMINKDLFWNSNLCVFRQFLYYNVPPFTNTSSGIWNGIINKYVGLKVNASNVSIYGWIRLNESGSYIIVKDYAYYRSPNDVDNPDGDVNFIIYPNPVSDNFTIETSQPATIEISNIEGQLIKTLRIIGTITNVDASEFSNGVYIVEVKTEMGIGVRKFIKE